MNLFHLMHEWELIKKYGIGGGFLVGLYIGLERQDFPFWSAIERLLNLKGDFAIQGSQLIYTVSELQFPTGGYAPHLYTLYLWPFFGWVIAFSFIGGLIAEGVSQKLATPAPTKPGAGTELAQKQAAPEPKIEKEEASSKKNTRA